MRKRLGFLFISLIFLICNLNAQQNILQNHFVINSKNTPTETYTKKILTSIALGMSKDLKATNIRVNFILEKGVRNKQNNEIEISISLNNVNLEGDTKYRGFSIDSLLIPEYGIVKVNVFTQNKITFSETVEIPLKGKKILIVPNSQSFTSGKTRVEIELINFKYSKLNFEQFNNINKLINYYYGYSLIMENLNKSSKETSFKTKMEASSVFIQWHKTSRVLNLINELNLSTVLNLNSYDPEKYVKKSKELTRHTRRAKTIANQTLEAELKKGFIADKQKYINGLVDFSEEVYSKGKEQQPYLQEAFRKSTLINTKAEEVKMMKRISDYYDMFSYYDDPKVPVLLYEYFVESAINYYGKSKNNMALRQLKNANEIQSLFEFPQSLLYSTTLANTLNGMIESFLKVSNMALKSGSYQMADNYYQNAEKVFNENLELFQQTNITATPFTIYVDAQTILARKLIIDDKFVVAEKLLSNCLKIQMEKGLNENKETRELIDKARNGIYKNILIEANKLLDQKATDQATTLMYEAKNYRNTFPEINENKLYDDVSYSIFLEYLQNGEILMDQGKHDEAIKNLLKAKEIQTDLLGYNIERLDELLKDNSVPVILDMIEEATYQTWAKRPEDAQKLMVEAEDMQIIYHQQDNAELNVAMQTLENKMNRRHCVDIQFQIKENSKSIVKQINKGNFSQANKIRINTLEQLESNNDCDLETMEIDSINHKYEFIFEFYENYNLMKSKLFSQGYDEAIDLYLKLRNTYFEKGIENYNFKLPSLYEFVAQQNLILLTSSSVSYFISKKQYQLAFEYLNLLKIQGVESANSKDLQIKLGAEFAKSFVDDIESRHLMANELSGDDKWFKYFIRAMK